MSGLNEDLQRRISEALDAGGVDSDEELTALLQADADAALYAADLDAIGEALGGLAGAAGPGKEPDWDAMAERIDARLESDEALDDIGDITAAPDFELEPEMAAPVFASPPAAEAAAPAVAPVVSLDAQRRNRRRFFAAVGGLAAAAAVGLGITAGLSMSSSEDMEMGAAPAAQAVATGMAESEEAPADMADDFAPPAASPEPVAALAEPPSEATGDWAGALDLAEAEPSEMPAAAAARPAPRRSLGGSGGMDSLFDQQLGGSRGRVGGGGGAGAGAPAPRPDPTASERARRRRARGRPGAGSPTGTQTASSAGPAAHPTETMRGLEPDVRRCMGTQRETAAVTVYVDGASGQLVNLRVLTQLDAAATRCIEARVRGAQFPTTGERRYSLRYVFRPAPVAGGSLSGTGNAARTHRRQVSPANPAPPTSRDLELAH